MQKPTLPSGTRDFGPAVMAKRQFIFDAIRKVFQTFGFQPLETPAMENLSTLTGKYGEEGDHLLFKILNTGDYLKAVAPEKLTAGNSHNLTPEIAEKGLRYDLTVPFARFVVMNKNEVTFPFKRYQMQPVWRSERPQKGRYREFYQCDADVVGTDSLLCEAEIMLMIQSVFERLRITDYTIKVNHRGILNGVAEMIGATGKETALFVAIDKLDKIGEEKVKEELVLKGFSPENLQPLFELLNAQGSVAEKIKVLKAKFANSEQGKKGLNDIETVFEIAGKLGYDNSRVDFDIPLARGLSYYTGCIFEVKINQAKVGSVSGGGRYDHLTRAFGDKENLSGVGFSFGVDRIYDAMEELGIFPTHTQISSKVLICHFDDESMAYGLGVVAKLRREGIASEIYPDVSKIKKQLDYANKKQIPYAILIGSDEISSGLIALKNLETGEQEKLQLNQIIERLKK